MRETLHALSNSLASARMWLAVLGSAPLDDREATLAEAIAKLNVAVGGAEESCHRLRRLLPPAQPRRT